MTRAKRRSTSSRRQVDLVYHADGLLIDNDGRQAEVSQSSSLAQESASAASPVSSTPASTANGEISSTAQPSTRLPTQISTSTQTSTIPPPLSAQQAAQQSFLIAPTTLVNLTSESSAIAMSSTSPSSTSPLSLQSTSTDMPSSSSSTPFSLSTPSSLLPHTQSASSTSSGLTSSAYVILPNTSSASASSASASAQALSTSGHHTSEFYIGIVFLSIVVAALCISFIAWIFRTCRRSPSCCLSRNKHDGDDMEKQDLGFGLGFYTDNLASSARIPHSPLDKKYSAPSQTTYSPYVATKPAQAYLGSAESLVPSFGALRIKNLVPGDVYSSGDEMSRQASRVGCELGTPREAIPGSTPRFLGLEGMGLDVPWSPAHIRSACSPSHVSVLQSPSRRSLSAKEESLSKNWESLPPLPAPAFARDSESSKRVAQDGWGATIRSSFRSALSVVTGGQTAKTSPPVNNDYFTSLPSRTSRSDLPRSKSVSSRRSQSRVSAHDDPFQEVPIDNAPASFSHGSFGHGAGFSGDFSQDVARAIGTSPLVIRKKSQAIGRRGSNESTRSRVLLSPGGIYRDKDSYSPAGIAGSSTPGVGWKYSTMPVRRKLSQSDRPTILKRGSTSGFSDASFETEASQALNEEEIAAKRVMRARRKTSSAVGAYF